MVHDLDFDLNFRPSSVNATKGSDTANRGIILPTNHQ